MGQLNPPRPSNKPSPAASMGNQGTLSLPQAVQQAVLAYNRGEWAQAERLCRLILNARADYFDALNLLGMIAAQTQRTEEAETLLRRAVAADPGNPTGHSHYGNILQELGQFDAAIASYDKAIALEPDYAQAWSNRGNALQELKQFAAAVSSYDKAIAIKPDDAQACYNRGNALQESKQFEAAVASYDRAIAIWPDYAEAYSNRGTALQELNRPETAVASYDKAIAIKPDYAEAYYNCGAALQELKQLETAAARYGKAIELKPDYVEAYYNCGNVLKELMQLRESEACYLKALELNPDYVLARWALAFTAIPPLFRGNEDLQAARKVFADALEDLDEWFVPSRMDRAYEAVGSIQPFYLAYQEFDNRKLLSRYGAICGRLMAHWQQANGFKSNQLAPGGKIKLGIVSDQIRKHSVWDAIIKGWILNFDLNRFELHIFCLSDVADEETRSARARATSFLRGKRSLAGWVEAILEKDIEALIYPEVGMHALTTQLANLRLAPLQLAAWGHPETTGLPTVDYYLSAELFEAGNSRDAYSESLVCLPHLGCNYARIPVPAREPDMDKLGLDTDRPILLCPGTLHKYAPQYDRLFVEIAKRLGRCKFVFFEQQKWWASVVRTRLRQVFSEANLELDEFVAFVSWLKQEDFYGLMRRADVFLDTIGFSGFNTVMQAVDCALPVVTREGRFMRGRLASGILRRMNMPELIAAAEEEYVCLAVRLVQDRNYRGSIAKKMLEHRDALYDDSEPVRALEEFLVDKCRFSK